MVFLFIPQAFAEYILFVSESCPHCKSLEEELQLKNYYEEFDIKEYEISENIELYIEMSKELSYSNGLVPLMIYEEKYFEGQSEIITFLEKDEIKEESSHTLSQKDLSKIDEILKEQKSETKEQKMLQAIFITTILIIALIATQKVFQLLHHKKEREHH